MTMPRPGLECGDNCPGAALTDSIGTTTLDKSGLRDNSQAKVAALLCYRSDLQLIAWMLQAVDG